MNPKSSVKVLHTEAIIEVNTVFAKMMENPLSDEYRLLQELRRDYPVYSVSRRQIKKNASQEHYKGLNYDYMEWYIIKYAPKEKKALEALLNEFEHQKDIASCHSKSKRYPVVKNRFLGKFPEVAKFGVVEAEETEAPAQESKETAEQKSGKVMDFPAPAEDLEKVG